MCPTDRRIICGGIGTHPLLLFFRRTCVQIKESEEQKKTADDAAEKKPVEQPEYKPSPEAKIDLPPSSIAPVLEKHNFDVPPEELQTITTKVSENFDNEQEAAMFMAQLMHESGGFMHTEEIACKDNPSSCAAQYDDGTGVPGKSYHGRGYIQLSWAENYRAAGEALGLGDQLVQHPELVAEDPEIAMDVSIWYWKERVANQPGYDPNSFGTTTKAINGALECTGQNVDKSKQRYEYYSEIADAMGIEDKASEAGCY
ncbi:Endochitinase EP3 [Dictyocoela roeselum]|nr:Endochitinase EP3 [Dictyocoela roeselum]